VKNLGLILLAGGSSNRFNAGLKQLLLVHNQPLYVHVLEKLTDMVHFDDVVIVLHESIKPIQNYKIASAGSTWIESVHNANQLLNPAIEHVMVHDAARPLFQKQDVEKLIEAAFETPIVALGSSVRNTLVRQKQQNFEIVERDNLFEVYTPQIIRKNILNNCKDVPCTDLITLGILTGQQTKILPSNPLNIKITYPSDISIIRNI
jgi:2-C-methyl-D-erythritol 4-phosphate cytidylyltransferase